MRLLSGGLWLLGRHTQTLALGVEGEVPGRAGERAPGMVPV